MENKEIVKKYLELHKQIIEFGKKLHALYTNPEMDFPIQSYIDLFYKYPDKYCHIFSYEDVKHEFDIEAKSYTNFVSANISDDGKYVEITMKSLETEKLYIPISYFENDDPEGFVNFEKERFENFIENNKQIERDKSQKTINKKRLIDCGLACPFCGKPVYAVITDSEGNIHNEPNYEKYPWTGLLYGVHHVKSNDEDKCPIATYEDECVGALLYDTVEELVNTWDYKAANVNTTYTLSKSSNLPIGIYCSLSKDEFENKLKKVIDFFIENHLPNTDYLDICESAEQNSTITMEFITHYKTLKYEILTGDISRSTYVKISGIDSESASDYQYQQLISIPLKTLVLNNEDTWMFNYLEKFKNISQNGK